MSRLMRNRSGQGLVEYVLLVVLMGILAIAAIKELGDKTKEGFSKSATALSTEIDNIN